MTEPQAWTLIGVFAAVFLGGMTAMTGFIRMTLRYALSGLGRELAGLRSELRGEVGASGAELRGEIGSLGAELRGEIGSLGAELRGEIGSLGAELRGEIGSLGAELRGENTALRAELRGEIGALRAEMASLRVEVNARFDAMTTRIDHLDGDVAALTKRVMGESTGE